MTLHVIQEDRGFHMTDALAVYNNYYKTRYIVYKLTYTLYTYKLLNVNVQYFIKNQPIQ